MCLGNIHLPSPLLLLTFSETTRSPSFPQGWWKGRGWGEVHKLIYLSLSVVLRTSVMAGVCSSPVIARLLARAPPFITSTQCPLRMTTTLIVCFPTQPQDRVWSPCFQAASYQSREAAENKSFPSGRVLGGIGAMLENSILGINEKQALQVTVIANQSTVDGSNHYVHCVS